MRHSKIHLTLLAAAFLTLVSCQRIPLYDAQSGVFLKLDYELELLPAVSEDVDLEAAPSLRSKVAGKLPEHVRACFFDATTHTLVRDVYLPAQGDFVNVEPGNYDLLVYALGTEVTQVTDGETRGGALAFTSRTGSKVKASKAGVGLTGESANIDNEIIFEPDILFTGQLPAVYIPVRSGQQEPVVLEVTMRSAVEAWTFVARNVRGVENVRKASVYMSGQASGKYLWDGRFPAKPVAVSFENEANPQKHLLFSAFNTFGKIPTQESYAILRITTVAGLSLQWVFDVTDQFENPDNERHEIVVEDIIDVPEGSGSGGGVEPSVSDWTTEIIDITLN